jgi:hypothetical protein
MNKPPPIDPRVVFEAVKDVKKTLNRKGARPGNLLLILDPVNDDVVIGTTGEMTLDETLSLLRMGLRGGTVDQAEATRHEIAVRLSSVKLPENFAVICVDKHTGEHLFFVHSVNLTLVVGEAMFQVGRLLGRMDAAQATKRASAGMVNPNPKVTLTAKPVSSGWRDKLSRFRSKFLLQ